MLYPPSTVRTQPPIRPPGFSKRSTDCSIYRNLPSNRSNSSISDMRLEDDIRFWFQCFCDFIDDLILLIISQRNFKKKLQPT